MRELQLLGAISELLTPASASTLKSVGDDAAVSLHSGPIATSVDQTVAGVHADMGHFTHEDFGWRSVATAISDLAAMGAVPAEVLLALALPVDTSEADARSLLAGADAAAVASGARIIGGDIVSSPTLSAAVTVIGTQQEEQQFTSRDGACAGDLVGVTGDLGASAAGLIQLRAGVTDELSLRHRRPTPRTLEGQALARAGVSSMIDISDGIATDAGHLGRASSVRLLIDLPSLPIGLGVAEVASQAGIDPFALATCGGEDFELLFTATREVADLIGTSIAGTQVSWIGSAVEGEPGTDLAEKNLTGWEHGA